MTDPHPHSHPAPPSTDAHHGGPRAAPPESANDRFKRSFGSRLWLSMLGATVLHFLVFALAPTMHAEDYSMASDDIETIDIPEELELPPEPEPITRPARPVISDAMVDEDITIEPTTFDANPVEQLPPPEQEVDTTGGGMPAFVPYEVAPRLTNEGEVYRAMERKYPGMLKNAGIGGTVEVLIHLDAEGRVTETRLLEGSGYGQFDQAALDVAETMEFSPAMNRDKRIAVWIRQSITFEVR